MKKKITNKFGNIPFVVSEFGIPFDMGGKQAFSNDKFYKQTKALNRSFCVMERSLSSCILWNYTCDNSNKGGDMWNGEDMSVFSEDQRSDKDNVYSGARAKEALIRPYPLKTAGKPVYMHFDTLCKRFEYVFDEDATVLYPTEIFVPQLHYFEGFKVILSDGKYEMDYLRQTLKYYPDSTKNTNRHRIIISKY